MIEQNVSWNDDIGEWQLRCVAYSGNNMRKQSPQPDKDKEKVSVYRLGCTPQQSLLLIHYSLSDREEGVKKS